MNPEVVSLRYASLERLRDAWSRRITQGRLYIPWEQPLREGSPVVLRLIVPDTPAPLELEGVVLALHVVEVDGQHLRGAEIDLRLPSFLRTAVEAYLDQDWAAAAPVLGDSSRSSRLWTTFGGASQSRGLIESGAITTRRHQNPPPTTDAFAREKTVRVASPAIALSQDAEPPPRQPPVTRPRALATPPPEPPHRDPPSIPPGAFIFRKS